MPASSPQNPPADEKKLRRPHDSSRHQPYDRGNDEGDGNVFHLLPPQQHEQQKQLDQDGENNDGEHDAGIFFRA
jgi:hypothetical protein